MRKAHWWWNGNTFFWYMVFVVKKRTKHKPVFPLLICQPKFFPLGEFYFLFLYCQIRHSNSNLTKVFFKPDLSWHLFRWGYLSKYENIYISVKRPSLNTNFPKEIGQINELRERGQSAKIIMLPSAAKLAQDAHVHIALCQYNTQKLCCSSSIKQKNEK